MHLAVIDPLPIYQQGMVAVLSVAGYQVDTPSDLMEWVHRGRDGLVLLTLAGTADWDLLARLRTVASQQQIIAVLTQESAGLGARAVRAGARSVLPRDVTPAVLRRTVEATLDGQAVLPAAVANVFVTGTVDAGDTDPVITADQLTWLRHLRAGTTITELSQLVGYSERAMYRLLRHLYQQLGARTRIEAIVHAQEQGLL
jgi:DNA-binding NarL/FixJ family response regulator